jgi:hypothetical protein
VPKVLIDGALVEVPATALFADDGQTPFAPVAVTDPATGRTFTEEDVARIRQEEKDKVYGRLEEANSALAELRDQVGSLTAAEQRRAAQLEEETQRLQAEARRQEEEGLDPATLVARAREEWQQTLANKEQEWNSRFEQEAQARQQAEALAAKEREYTDLRDYIQGQVEANKDSIAPELLPWIQGTSKDEVDAAIARAVETTNSIAEQFQQLAQLQQFQQPVVAQPPATPGTRTTAPVGTDPGAQFQQLTAEDIANMPMDQYAKMRPRLGIGAQGQNRGLFG